VKELQRFRSQIAKHVGKARYVSSRVGKTLNETRANGISRGRHHNGNGRGLTLYRSNSGRGFRDDYIWAFAYDLFRKARTEDRSDLEPLEYPL